MKTIIFWAENNFLHMAGQASVHVQRCVYNPFLHVLRVYCLFIRLSILVTIMVAATAAVPSASIVVLILVSAGVGIPVEDRLGLLMAVDWFL